MSYNPANASLEQLLTNALVRGLSKTDYFAQALSKEIGKNKELMDIILGQIDPKIVGEALAKQILIRAHRGSPYENDIMQFIRKEATKTAQDILADKVAIEVMNA